MITKKKPQFRWNYLQNSKYLWSETVKGTDTTLYSIFIYHKVCNNQRERKGTNLEAAEVSSSSQWRMCLTLRLKTVTDCLTSLFNSITTAPTPATVSMKFVKPILSILRIRFEDCSVSASGLGRQGFKEGFMFCFFCFCLEKQPRQLIRSFVVIHSPFSTIPFSMGRYFAIIWAFKIIKAQILDQVFR